jgi:hypothetical protein
MGFWKFCEKVACCIGLDYTLHFIFHVKWMYEHNYTVAQCAEVIKTNNSTVFLYSPTFNRTFTFDSLDVADRFMELNPSYYVYSTKPMDSNTIKELRQKFKDYGAAANVKVFVQRLKTTNE